MVAAAIGGSAVLGAGTSLLGSGKSSSASKESAEAQYYSTMAAINETGSMYTQNVARLDPFVQSGYLAQQEANQIARQTPAGTAFIPMAQQAYGQQAQMQGLAQNYLQQAAGMTPPSVVTENWLQQTPGYQWQLGQGLAATQANAAARGLGVSGSSLKGAATYATGLADSNYQNQYQNAQTAWQDVMNQSTQAQNIGSGYQNLGAAFQNLGTFANATQQQQYTQFANLANLGESAAAQTAQSGTALGQSAAQSYIQGGANYGNYLSQAGQAQAAGTAGVGNAFTSGVNNYLMYNALQNSFGGSTTGGFTTAGGATGNMWDLSTGVATG